MRLQLLKDLRTVTGTACFCLLLISLLIAGCDQVAKLPVDPEGTLEKVRGGTVRTGVIHAPPWVNAVDGNPSGLEASLVRQVAKDFRAKVDWVQGGPDQLVARLEKHELDLLIGGFERSSPLTGNAGKTRPYATVEWWVVAREHRLLTDVEGNEIAVSHGRAAALVKKANATPVFGSAGADLTLRAVPLIGKSEPAPLHKVFALGETQHVLLVPPGENAWLLAVERSLREAPATRASEAMARGAAR